MEEPVECAECGNEYDSGQQPFCPRCGSDSGRAAARASYHPRGSDPRRRRAQAGGVILILLGTLALVQSGWTLVAPPDLDADQLEVLSEVDLLRGQPGGALHVQVLSNGTPLDGAVVTWRHLNGTELGNATTVAGWANTTGLASAFANVTVAWERQQWLRHVYVPEGDALTVRVDVVHDEADVVAWQAVAQLTATRVLSAFLVMFSAFVVVGGVMALRLRAWGIAITAAALAVLPSLLIVAIIPLAGVLFLLPTGAAALLIGMGRSHFR